MTTPPNEKKVREFFLNNRFPNGYVADPSGQPYGPDDIHVIEYSAYLQLQTKLERAVDVLSELADLMDDVRTGDYKPDSFTTQPAREALKDIGEGGT